MLIKSQGGGRTTFPKGKWAARIVRIKSRESQQGNPMLTLVWRADDGQSYTDADGVDKALDGAEVLDNLTLIESAEWRVAEYYEAITGEEYPQSGEDWDANRLTESSAFITVDEEEFNGRMRPRVMQVEPM